MAELIIMFVMMCLIIVMLKLIFCEMDGRRANKQYNVRFFLNLDKPFKYGRTNYMIVIIFIIFLISSGTSLFTAEGLLDFFLFLCFAIIMDVVSQYAYYAYAKRRFKGGIEKANELKATIENAKQVEDYQNIVYPSDYFNYNEVVESYFRDDYHICVSSIDGGRFVDSLSHVPPITYVIDAFTNQAKELLADKNIKVTSLTDKNGLPFKDQKLDLFVVDYANFDKADVHRILKDDGYVILCHRGNDNLKELNTMYLPNVQQQQWNRYLCSSILEQNGFVVVDSREVNSKGSFRTIEALLTYLKRISPEKVKNSDMYLNQLALIDSSIRQQGYFDLTMHEFYIVAKKQ